MKLTIRWSRWRRERYRSLVSDGMPTGIAFTIAHEEALARRKIGRIIGHCAAEAAQLLCTSDGEALRFQIIGNGFELTEAQVTRLRHEAGAQIASIF